MAEYITKKAAINAVENAPIELFQSEWEETEEAINATPAADVAPVIRWIPITERLPKPETEVMIVCNRNGRRFIATAIHEDGTLFVGDSDWSWNDSCEYGRYDEERDDYIIPECWWESRCFTPDDVYNCPVDCEVTHWMPMPELPKEEDDEV
jgi:hypothetical protein